MLIKTILCAGPYADAVLRFQILFPDAYPRVPPVILFSTDVFHPLTAPLTTYMHTTDIQDNGTVSATDDERLPAGGFSLSHGFPEWFGRKRAASAEERRVSGERIASPVSDDTSEAQSPDTRPRYPQSGRPAASMYKVLKYMRSTFDNAEMLDSVPLSAAGNPGAWHAWQAYRKKQGLLQDTGAAEGNVASSGASDAGVQASSQTVRRPGEWNWDGVWEDRVKRNIAASLSEPVLYGGAGVADEVVSCEPSLFL